MRKLLFCLIPLFLFLRPIDVKASFMPPVVPTNTNTVVDFIVSSAITDLAQNGVRVLDKDSLNSLNNIINGQSILASTNSSYLDLSNSQSWLNTTLWRSDGSSVLPQDAYMALVQTDAGTATAIYAKDDAEMLLIGDTWGSAESSLISGVLGNNQTHRFPLTEPVLTQRYTNNGVFTSPTLSQEVKDEFESYAFSGYARSTAQGFICFIPNGCSLTTRLLPVNGQYTVNIQSSNSFQGIDYVTENPNDIIWVNPNNSGYAKSKVYTRGYGGRNWTYTSGWFNAYNPFWQGGEMYFHAPTDAQYNALKNSEVVYTEPVNNTYDVTNNYYSYTTYNNSYPTYSSTVNNNYDRTADISPENYPKNQNVYLSDYSPTYNYYESYETVINNPNIGGDIGEIDPTEITDGIPILNNLQRRFPFSIPFDIYNMLSGLSAQRVAPEFHYELEIPTLNYTWDIDVDLSAWDDVAELFRVCFLILFIISLAVFAYRHYFGS